MSEGAVSRAEYDALKAELVALRQRVDALASKQEAFGEEERRQEVLQVIAAAVAAYLGKKATVRFVRRIHDDESDAWSARGRAVLSGSHSMPRTIGW